MRRLQVSRTHVQTLYDITDPCIVSHRTISLHSIPLSSEVDILQHNVVNPLLSLTTAKQLLLLSKTNVRHVDMENWIYLEVYLTISPMRMMGLSTAIGGSTMDLVVVSLQLLRSMWLLLRLVPTHLLRVPTHLRLAHTSLQPVRILHQRLQAFKPPHHLLFNPLQRHHHHLPTLLWYPIR